MKSSLFLLASLLFLNCNDGIAQQKIDGKFVHSVLFWLKAPQSQSSLDSLVSGLELLSRESEWIISAHLGLPAMTDRTVVDNSYSLHYLVTFDSKEDQEAYQVETIHLSFIENYKHLWKKVQIYDSISSKE